MKYRYIRNIICMIVVATCAFYSSAETVSQKEAMRVAQTFFNTLYGEVTAPAKLVWNGRQLTTDRLFSPFYIYNSPKGGFVIISAENKAYPVLTYSRTESFGRERLGDEENDLLTRYAREIELIRYDSRIPTSAIDSWQNLPAYIDRIINNPYYGSEYNNLSDEGKEYIERIDRRNGWIAMPSAVEFSIYNPEDFRELTIEDVLAESDVEEIPFSFYEEFLSSIAEDEKASQRALEEMITPSKPLVKSLGGSHFEIIYPDNVQLVKIYSLDGSRSMEKYYRSTSDVNLDLSALSPGFYICMALGEDRKIYGVKLYR